MAFISFDYCMCCNECAKTKSETENGTSFIPIRKVLGFYEVQISLVNVIKCDIK